MPEEKAPDVFDFRIVAAVVAILAVAALLFAFNFGASVTPAGNTVHTPAPSIATSVPAVGEPTPVATPPLPAPPKDLNPGPEPYTHDVPLAQTCTEGQDRRRLCTGTTLTHQVCKANKWLIETVQNSPDCAAPPAA